MAPVGIEGPVSWWIVLLRSLVACQLLMIMHEYCEVLRSTHNVNCGGLLRFVLLARFVVVAAVLEQQAG